MVGVTGLSPSKSCGRASNSVSSSLMGSLAKGKVCGNSAENLWKFGKTRYIASGKGAEILRKVCGNFAEICGKFSAMTPSRTTP